MTLTLSELERAAGISTQAAELWLPHINAALREAGCTTPTQVAQFIAQNGHESGGFTRLVESLDYSVDALLRTFGRHRISEADARQYGRIDNVRPANQQAIACCVYGGSWGLRNLGNRWSTMDGWDYRGRGLTGITGRNNYQRCGDALGLDLISHPSLLEVREHAAMSAAWFWRERKLAAVGGNVERATAIINGGNNGIEDRRKRYGRAISVLGVGLRKVGEVAP